VLGNPHTDVGYLRGGLAQRRGVFRRRTCMANGADLEHVRMRFFAWMINYSHGWARGNPPLRPYMTITVPNISDIDVRDHESDIHRVHTLTNATALSSPAVWHAHRPSYGWPPSLNKPPLSPGLHTSDIAPARSGMHAPSCGAGRCGRCARGGEAVAYGPAETWGAGPRESETVRAQS
jgi:hypothetical protein